MTNKLPNWLDIKTLVLLVSIGSAAAVSNYRLESIEANQGKTSLNITSVETELQSLKLAIVQVQNQVNINRDRLNAREQFVLDVTNALKQHGETLIKTETLLEVQSGRLIEVIKMLKN
jgi:septal ring factor EnvC (AmiA/AmiB activator)